MTTIKQVMEEHQKICADAQALIAEKGRDYNRSQQLGGDTLFNLTVCKELGIVDHVTQGILVRLSDKFMRLCSLASNPIENPAVKDESVRDTIRDSINYLVYLYIKYKEEREHTIGTPAKGKTSFTKVIAESKKRRR